MLTRIFILSLLLIVAPIIVGTFFTGVDNSVAKLPFRWISGQILLWAGFQVICVPLILNYRNLSDVVLWFNCFIIVMAILAAVYYLARKSKVTVNLKPVEKYDRRDVALWVIFGILLIVQLLCAIFLAYEEGDDAYYVAVSTTTAESGYLYRIQPYLGVTTNLDTRHGLAPFPIWVAYLAKMSGMPAVTVAQIILPVVLITMAYALYYCIGKVIIGKYKKLPLFMIIVEVMVLFGGYTTYSAENFLLVRSAQGKAVLAAILIPFLFLLMYLLVEKVHRAEKIKLSFWMLLLLVQTAGCLCSTLGTVLTCMLIAIVGLCVLVCYKKWRLLIPMAASCAMPVCYAALYFLVG